MLRNKTLFFRKQIFLFKKSLTFQTTLVYLQNQKITVVPPLYKREVVQCMRCQRYGHTKKYCSYNPRCVKCGQNHLTSECVKDKSAKPTCALCSKDHPASYKGCAVYKEIKIRKFPALRKKEPEQATEQATEQTQPRPPKFDHGKTSYADATKSQASDQNVNDNQRTTDTDTIITRMMGRMDQMMEKMDKMLNLLLAVVSKMI